GHASAQCADAEYAATRGHRVFAFDAAAGVEHLGVTHVRHVPGVDLVAGAWRSRIAFGRHHDAQRGARIPVDFDAFERAVDAGLDQRGEVRAQAHHDRLRFRVAEAHVELDDLRRAVGVDHQPG